MRRAEINSGARRAAPDPVATADARAPAAPVRVAQRRSVALLDEDTIKLIEAHVVAIYVATADTVRRPHVARAFGCRASSKGRVLTTWVSRSSARPVLDDIARNGRLAFTVSHIASCRTLQLKGTDAEIVEADADSLARVRAHQEGFVQATMALGYPEHVMRHTIDADLDEIVAVRFSPTAVFKQTPGVGAGAALERAADAFAS